jgi:BlaI family transcriptional regulator, penicillinase repressor
VCIFTHSAKNLAPEHDIKTQKPNTLDDNIANDPYSTTNTVVPAELAGSSDVESFISTAGRKSRCKTSSLWRGVLMTQSSLSAMSRRERQIMEIVYCHGRATASEIHRELPDRPSYSTVRTLLKVLEQKEYLTHENDGPRYVYLPCISTEKAKLSAMKQLLRTFFNNSVASAMSALLDMSASKLSKTELKRLAQLIQQAKNKEEGHD